MPVLDERKASILRTVVREYIETAQPVGSSRVARAQGFDVSPATVRNDMVVLEREGYLVQPHTSAGRIPTDKGYRFFVDQITDPGVLPAVKKQQVRDFFARAHGELEHMLRETSQLLSNLTDCAAVVVGPPHERAAVRSFHFVDLNGSIALAVAVLSNGVVEKRTIEMAPGTGAEVVATVNAHICSLLVGRTLAEAIPLAPVGEPAADALVAAVSLALSGSHHDEIDQLFVRGASRMALAFSTVDTVRQVLATLEQQYVVISLVREVLDGSLSVSIGSELGLEPLSECSLVVAPYEVEGELVGTIGVLGPTRMNYPHAMAAVAVVSQRLGSHLSD